MKNLNLSLYAFHLCQSLDDAPDTQSPDAGLLWDSLRGLAKKLPFSELEDFGIAAEVRILVFLILIQKALHRLALLFMQKYLAEIEKFTEPTEANPENTLNFQAIEIDDISLTGNLSTFKIHDTYSADLTLTLPDKQADFLPENAAIFQPEALIAVTANLGKVLWLSGESEDLNQLQLSSAQDWAKKLCHQAEYMTEDRLFNCPLFIFYADSVTILISLAKPGAVNLERAQNNYYHLRNLFWTYQKIVLVSKLAKEGYQGARKLYSELEEKVKEFNQVFLQTPEERLKKLDELLKNIPQRLLDYNCKLRDLKAHYITIEVNLQNFRISLSHIQDEKAGDKLSYWSDFATKTAPDRLQQIKTYIDYLEPGQVLFSDLINSIRATTELEQAKSNQDLQDHIQAVGVGIAAGAIVASSSGLITQPWYYRNGEPMELPFTPPHPFIIALFWSIFCSWGAWQLAERLIKKGRPKDK